MHISWLCQWCLHSAPPLPLLCRLQSVCSPRGEKKKKGPMKEERREKASSAPNQWPPSKNELLVAREKRVPAERQLSRPSSPSPMHRHLLLVLCCLSSTLCCVPSSMPPTSAVRVPPAIHHQLVMSSRCVSYISQALATGAATVTEVSLRLHLEENFLELQ